MLWEPGGSHSAEVEAQPCWILFVGALTTEFPWVACNVAHNLEAFEPW
ncbi:MAG: hypothetical protein ACI83Y_001315 [Candidatus Azotimanducaceae bacterium]|jgi:hypothetical protein